MHTQEIVLCKRICTGEDDLDTILTEVRDIVDVLELGLALGIRKSALDKIMTDNRNLEHQKLNVIYYWLTRREIVRKKQNEHPTWGGLADAVDCVNPTLSERIRHKYCDGP